MHCPDVHLLTEFIENRLSDDRHREWVTHFAGCDRCTSQLALALKLRESDEVQQSAEPSATIDVIEFAPHLKVELRRQRKSGLQGHSRWFPLLAAAAIAGFFLMQNLRDDGGQILSSDSLGSAAIATMLLKASTDTTTGISQTTAPFLSFKPTHSPTKEAYQAGYSLAHVTFLVGSGSTTTPSEQLQPIASKLSSDYRQLLAELREGKYGTLDSTDLPAAVALIETELDRQLPQQYRKLGGWVFGANHSLQQRDETYFRSATLPALLTELEMNGHAPGVKKLLEKIQFYAADGLVEDERFLIGEHLADITLLMQ
ncbi:MAG TPA: hypothetical protein EYG15_00510 [Deltaproteobacteria bacterium]|nr:hypothetical protein [Deltaproteobacteria bacterium]